MAYVNVIKTPSANGIEVRLTDRSIGPRSPESTLARISNRHFAKLGGEKRALETIFKTFEDTAHGVAHKEALPAPTSPLERLAQRAANRAACHLR